MIIKIMISKTVTTIMSANIHPACVPAILLSFSQATWFNSHNTTLNSALLLTPIVQMEKLSWRNMFRLTQLLHGVGRLLMQISFFFFNWSMADKEYYIGFRCTTQWFDNDIHHEMLITISVVTICHHTKLLQYHWLYSLCYILYPCDLFIL